MIETIQEKAAPEVVAAVKAGELSLNAAAVVATLPEEEQQAVAAEGADALKQAAKRVRDAKKSPRPPSPKPKNRQKPRQPPAPKSCRPASPSLEAENERLRLQVKTLQDLLAEQG